MVRHTDADDRTADAESLSDFAEYLNDRQGNFRAYVDDRNIHDGDDCVVVSTGTTGNVSTELAMVQGAGWSVDTVESDGDTYEVVAIPPETAEWVFDMESTLAENAGIDTADGGSQ
jgi:hypothetical protein